MRNMKFFILLGMTPCLVQCGGGGGSSFSLLSDSDTFVQSEGAINDKVDILWMIDSSGSMESSQGNLATNFNSFITEFQGKGLDFKMAVTGTDAYRKLFSGGSVCAPFRSGPVRIQSNVCQAFGTHTGIPIITPGTPNLSSVFINSVLQGVSGGGDERSLQSLRVALDDPANAGFVRQDSFLSVIVLTDEDDFSHDGSSNIQGVPYNDSRLHPVSNYVSYLDGLTGTSGAARRYNVNSIAILDNVCRDLLNQTFTGRRIAERVNQLADATGGFKASLCGNFANDLREIANNILTLATQFRLSRLPKPETIVVIIDGVTVPNRNQNPGPSVGGWDYDVPSNSIRFYGDHIPDAGSVIRVTFDPQNYGS
jgi:hypothetical protein